MTSLSIPKVAVVMTSIAAPNAVMQTIATQCRKHQWRFIVVGDRKSPPDFALDDCAYYSLQEQRQSELHFAEHCPVDHYARKNIGYLLAMQDGATQIVETDDDNLPQKAFFDTRKLQQQVAVVQDAGWVNAYAYFSETKLWPRGLPLDVVHRSPPPYVTLPSKTMICPIQQGLADANPDVDAVYRLLFPLPCHFQQAPSIALADGSWSPFNSQNTTWFSPAFPLLYLPAYCSFRMTDIWRSFVAQRIAFENDWGILFHAPTVVQERNVHDLMRDFAEEIPGYLHNQAIKDGLEGLDLKHGEVAIPENMRICYQMLVDMKLVESNEMILLDAWLEDLSNCFSKVG